MHAIARTKHCALLLILALALPRAEAACPTGEQEQCLIGVCVCLPDEVQEAGGLILEQWLIASRDQAVVDTSPMPADLRRKLAPFFDADILDAARYRIDADGDYNLAALNLQYGDVIGNRVAAVTLIDVIVFRDARAAANPAVWAHELFHVKQFRDWGVREFAMRYARNFDDVEGPAYAFQAAYERSAKVQR